MLEWSQHVPVRTKRGTPNFPPLTGGEEGECHREDHDCEPQHKAADPTLPGMGELVVILALQLLQQLVHVRDAFSLENLER